MPAVKYISVFKVVDFQFSSCYIDTFFPYLQIFNTVSYTHLTLPTNREV